MAMKLDAHDSVPMSAKDVSVFLALSTTCIRLLTRVQGIASVQACLITMCPPVFRTSLPDLWTSKHRSHGWSTSCPSGGLTMDSVCGSQGASPSHQPRRGLALILSRIGAPMGCRDYIENEPFRDKPLTPFRREQDEKLRKAIETWSQNQKASDKRSCPGDTHAPRRTERV